MDDYHELQVAFTGFHELLGNTIQRHRDRAEQQEARDQELNARFKRLEKRENQEAHVRSLESENGRLREQIEALQSELVSVSQDSDNRQKKYLEDQKQRAPSAVIYNYGNEKDRPDPIPCAKYSELACFYDDLYGERALLIEAYCSVRAKLTRCNAKLREWHRFFERETIEVDVNGKNVIFRRVGDDEPPSVTPGRVGREQEQESPTLPEIPQRKERHQADPVSPTQCRTSGGDPRSTQSQDSRWPMEESLHVSEGFSDAPTVVAENPVNERRSGNCDEPASACEPYHRQTGSFTRPVMVKSESSSSGSFTRTTTLATSSDGTATAPALGPDRRAQSPETEMTVFEDRPQLHKEPSPDFDQRGTNDPPPAGRKRRALQALDNNTVVGQRPSERDTKRRKWESRGAIAVPSVAEDGEEQSYQRDKATSKTPDANVSSNPAGESPTGRLAKLLGEAVGPKPILTPSPRHRLATKAAQIQPFGTPENARAPVAIQDETRRDHTTAVQNPRSVSDHRAHMANPSMHGETHRVSPEDEPYRARPPRRLGLEHFKVNPERNHGLDFPFQEVVRNKEERRCLSGCVRRDCCGPIFRSLAIEGRLGRSKVPETVSFGTLDDEDRHLLEEYLGRSKSELTMMSNSELRNTLIDARAKELADQYGKHRHAHERARSPPGFWRSDMPSTQEEERDRELASEMERVKVMERYREAMRPDGLWMFADE